MKRSIVLLCAAFGAALVLAGCSTAPIVAPTPSPMSPAPASSTPAGMRGSAIGTAAPRPAPAAPLTGEALIGQTLFMKGQTPSGPVEFTGGVNAGNGACMKCHSPMGSSASGPMIGWMHLTEHMDMANMPKFVYTTATQVIKAITTGVRPNGTKLTKAMPRYKLTSSEASALIAYLMTRK